MSDKTPPPFERIENISYVEKGGFPVVVVAVLAAVAGMFIGAISALILNMP